MWTEFCELKSIRTTRIYLYKCHPYIKLKVCFHVYLLACVQFCSFFFFNFFLLYSIVLVLPQINMNLPRVYACSPSWTPLPPPSPYHPSESSQCTSPKHPVSNLDWQIVSYMILYMFQCHLPWSLSSKESACNAGAAGDTGLIPRLRRSLGEGHDTPLQYSCLEYPMGREAWWATVHRVTKSRTELKRLCMHTHFLRF